VRRASEAAAATAACAADAGSLLESPFELLVARRVVCLACREAPDPPGLGAEPWLVSREGCLTLDLPEGGAGAWAGGAPGAAASVEQLLAAYLGASRVQGFVCGNAACSHAAHDAAGAPLADNAQRVSRLLRCPPLLALHAELDEWIKIEWQRGFIERLRNVNAPAPTDLVVYPRTGAPHEHIGFGSYAPQAKDAGVQFLAKHLLPPDEQPTD
jgi:hypothetical protein